MKVQKMKVKTLIQRKQKNNYLQNLDEQKRK